ncbi:MAG: FAD-binding protein, partial [Glaciihabitans sp.]|nr:FAD-binding protein [Glaciihabitans sp.]
RHSFNALADTEGTLVHLGGITTPPQIDEAAMTVTVGAATRYGVVASYLQERGFALHNMGSLPHISVGGATATGTHGSGDTNGNLSSAVNAIEIVGADGELRQVRRGDPTFDAMVVGLGAFGIVTRLSLDIHPTFDVRQDAFVDLSWQSLLDNVEEVFSAAYSVSVMTKWTGGRAGQLWLKTRVGIDYPALVDVAHLGAVPAPATLFEVEAGGEGSNLNLFGGVVGPWSERLPHFRLDRMPSSGEEIQSEYLVPRENIVAALSALRGLGERIDPVLLITELRSVAADDLWMSGASGRDVIGVHFTWARDFPGVNAVLPDIEAALLPLGGRPHWGKHFLAGAAELAPLYPKLPEWKALVAEHDPNGKFRSAFLEEKILG